MQYGSIITPRPALLPKFNARSSTVGQSVNVDWSKLVPPDGDMLGNDDYGCCDPAADFRIIQLWGGKCDKQLVLNRYAQLTGFRAGDVLTDNGTDTNLDMRAWCAFPVYDGENVWPVYWAQIEPNETDQLVRALQRFPLLATIVMPEAAADEPESWVNQPGTGKAWEPTIAHRVVLLGADGNRWKLRTWGRDYWCSLEMFNLFIEQGVVDVPIPTVRDAPEDFDLDGIDFDALSNDMAAMGLHTTFG